MLCFPVMHYVMLFSACIIYVTAIAFMCFANKHIIIIIIIDVANFKQNSKTVCLCWSAKFRSKSKFNAEDTNPEVSTAFHEVRSGIHTTEGDVPSTPSLSLRETANRQQFQPETSAVQKLYV